MINNIPQTLFPFNTDIDKEFYSVAGNVWGDENTFNIEYAWELHSIKDDFLAKQTLYISPSAKVAKTAILDNSKGAIVVSDNAIIEDFVKIVGPAFIGENVYIGEYSMLRGSCSIEKDAKIGTYTEIVRSIIMSACTIHYSYISDSILGPHTKVGGGFLSSNKRFDRKPVTTVINDQKINSNRVGFGVITGAHVTIGARVTTMPGVMIGSDAIVYPGLVINKNIEHGVTIKQ